MKTRTIYIGKGQFISNLCAFLPGNAFINKKWTGCGGTTAELLSKRHSIIIVPNVPVILGKVKKMKIDYDLDVLGIYYPFNTQTAITDYLTSEIQYKNILVTPESYKHLIKAFNNPLIAGKYDRYKDFFLLFDESEKIVQDVAYRKTISEPINDFFKYENRSMISATPILPSDPRFEQHGFEHVIFEPTFDYSTDIDVVVTNNIIYATSKYLRDNPHTHYCFFMNSTDGILSLINHLKIEDDSFVFCGDDSVKKLRRHKFYNVSSELLPIKKYNFFTSRFYSAVDIDLEIKPNVVLLTDLLFAEQSIFDPATESIQAIGRFRNKINKATHITNINPNIEYQSREMALKYIEGGLEAYKTIFTFRESALNPSGTWDAYQTALRALPTKNFVVEGTAEIDYFKLDNKLDEEMVKSYYSDNILLVDAYKILPNFKVTSRIEFYNSSDKDRLTRARAKNETELFKAIVHQLEQFKHPIGTFQIDNRIEVTNELAALHPEMVKAYSQCGKSMIEKAGYKFKRLEHLIKEKMINERFMELPVIRDILCAFNADVDIPVRNANEIIGDLRKKYGLKGTNAVILNKYFTVSTRYQKRIRNIREWCIKLTNPKFTLDD